MRNNNNSKNDSYTGNKNTRNIRSNKNDGNNASGSFATAFLLTLQSLQEVRMKIYLCRPMTKKRKPSFQGP